MIAEAIMPQSKVQYGNCSVGSSSDGGEDGDCVD